MTQLLIVKVGNDDIPAIDKDIRGITEKMGKMLGAESIVIAFPHNTTFETLDIQPDELLVVKVGNDNHPASDEDLENMQDDIEEAFRIPGPRCGLDAPLTYPTVEEAQVACENYLFEWIKPLVLMSNQIEAANNQIKEKI